MKKRVGVGTNTTMTMLARNLSPKSRPARQLLRAQKRPRVV
jgi:hypothetical protein